VEFAPDFRWSEQDARTRQCATATFLWREITFLDYTGMGSGTYQNDLAMGGGRLITQILMGIHSQCMPHITRILFLDRPRSFDRL